MTVPATTGTTTIARTRGRPKTPETPMALLVKIDHANPTYTKNDRLEDFIELLMMPKHAALLRAFITQWFPLMDNKLHPTKTPRPAPTPAEIKKRKKIAAKTLDEDKKIAARHFMTVGYMECPMPNGKVFGDCTIGEVRRMAPDIGGLVTIIANLKGPAKAVIRKTYTNAQLLKLAA